MLKYMVVLLLVGISLQAQAEDMAKEPINIAAITKTRTEESLVLSRIEAFYESHDWHVRQIIAINDFSQLSPGLKITFSDMLLVGIQMLVIEHQRLGKINPRWREEYRLSDQIYRCPGAIYAVDGRSSYPRIN